MASNDLQKSTKTKDRLKTKLSKEDAALLRFKDEIADVLTSDQDDYNLQKWLKARQYDVKKAVDMYRASLAYKKKMNVEKILEEYDPPEVLKKYSTGGFLGYDKEGSPLVIEFYGHLDMKGLMYSAKKVDLEKNKIMQCETIVRDWQQQSEKRGKRVDGLTVIFDMDGVSTKMLWRPGLQMYLHLVKVLEDNYPEMLKRMFVINAPRIFPLLYKLARPLISEDTKNKIHVLGGNFKDILMKFIDAEYLPVYLGGLKTDPDGNPRCVTMICQGGEVPREYFLLDKDHEDCMDTVHVSRRQRLRFEYDVTRPGSILRWEFKTDGFDIGFGVNFLSDKEKVVLITVERVNSHIVPEDGSIVCNTAGKYEIVFDNSFSWARSKRIMYLVEIITPPEDDGIRNEIKRLQEGESMHNLRAC